MQQDDGALVVWIDYMKAGVVSKDELNNSITMLSKALAALPEKSIGFVIAPHAQSERRGGLRDELRTECGHG